MKNNLNPATFDDNLECFGSFDISSKLCIKRCALSIKCIIEKDYNKNNQNEFIDDLLFSNETMDTIQ